MRASFTAKEHHYAFRFDLPVLRASPGAVVVLIYFRRRQLRKTEQMSRVETSQADSIAGLCLPALCKFCCLFRTEELMRHAEEVTLLFLDMALDIFSE